MPSLTFSIGGPEIDISNKSSKEVLDIIKKEYNKKKKLKFNVIKKCKEDSGFGTQYHDGTGFDDCDKDNTGWRKCKDEPNKNKWCSECTYLNNAQAKN